LNIPAISVTLSVLRFSMPVNVTNLEQP
jgi:hypothetical protein